MLPQKKYIENLKPYISGIQKNEIQRQYGLNKITKLNANESPWGSSPKAKRIIKKLDTSVYPDDASQELIKTLSHLLSIPKDNLILGNGSDEILLILALGYLQENQEVLISENTFSQYSRVSLTMGAKIRYIACKNYHYDLNIFSKTLSSKTKMVFLCNPNNPTGTYFTDNQLKELLEKAPSSCVVVLDEAYSEFASATNFPKSIDLIKKYSNLVIIRTFSKAYGLAGVRLGYAISNPNNIEYLKKILAFNPFNINIVAQNMANQTLLDTKFISKILRKTQAGKHQIEEALIELKLNFLPTQGNFICFHTDRPSKELTHLMTLQGILVRPVDNFGLEGWCRVTIGSKKQNKLMLSALKKCLK